MTAMELNMHGNPPRIATVRLPHENTNDEIIRQRAWEDLTDFITETPEAIDTIMMGDLSPNLHAQKGGRRGTRRTAHIRERNRLSEKQGTQHTCKTKQLTENTWPTI